MSPTSDSTNAAPPLTTAHRAHLREHAVTDEVIDAAGIFSEGGFIGFPYRDGNLLTVQWRPWPGEAGDYRWEKDKPLHLACWRDGGDDGPVIIAEGTKQSLAVASHAPEGYAVFGMQGIRGWVNTDLSRFEGRDVLVIADADASGNLDVYTGAERLGEALTVGGARVKFATSPGRAKDGIDDFLATISPERRERVLVNLLAQAKDKPAPRRPKPKNGKGSAGNSAGSSATVSGGGHDTRPKVEVTRGDGAGILAATEDIWRRYIVFGSEAEVVAVTLWAMHTHAIDAADCTPYIDVGAPVFESGKTRVLEIAELLTRRAWRLSEPTEATLFRKVAGQMPTLLLDEYDAVWGNKADGREGLRAVFDVGYRRGGSVPRCVGEGTSLTVEDFPVFCAKMLAGIPPLPRAIATRSIPVRLRRKKKSEVAERFRDREAKALIYPLRDRLAAWAELMAGELRDAVPSLPYSLTDRQQDCWEPLFAIADAAGGDWPQRAREAAVRIHVTDHDDPSTGELLLRHVADAFVTAQAAWLSTETVLRALTERDDGPWADFWEKPLAEIPPRLKGPSMRLARMLRPFDVVPEQIWVPAGGKIRGYRMESFYDAWERYGIAVTPEPGLPPSQDGRTRGASTQSTSSAQRSVGGFDRPTDLSRPEPLQDSVPIVLPTKKGGWSPGTGNPGDGAAATVTESNADQPSHYPCTRCQRGERHDRCDGCGQDHRPHCGRERTP